MRTRVRDDNAALASSTLHQLSTMSSLPPPLLPLAELLGDSVEASSLTLLSLAWIWTRAGSCRDPTRAHGCCVL